MVQLFGPKIATVTFSAEGDTVFLPGLDVSSAKTIKQALSIYGQAYKVALKPYDGRFDEMPFDPANPKYFICSFDDETDRNHGTLVDIHVRRDEEEICIKQDLDFELRDGDIVDLGQLAC